MSLIPTYIRSTSHPEASGLGQSIKFSNLDSHVSNILNLVYVALSALAVIYLIYSGIRYITANGNKDALAQAKQGIIYALLGIAVILLSYSIIALIANLAGSL